MSWRTKKRLIYVFIFLLILFLIFFSIYLKFKKPVEQCLNNRQDKNEEGIDCGGPCLPCELRHLQPLKIYPIKFLTYTDKTFDIIGSIENPNQNLALKKLRYQFLIYDLNNNLKITMPLEETVLLPLEKKYLVKVNNQAPDFILGKIELKVFEPQKDDWIKASFEKLPVTFYNEKVFKENNRVKVGLTLFNNSFKSQKDIEVIVFIYNNSKLIGTSKSLVNLNPQEVRSITLILPSIEIEPTGLEIYLQKRSL